MHILGQCGKENAAAIFDLFLDTMPDYPIDKPDKDGNTRERLLIIDCLRSLHHIQRCAETLRRTIDTEFGGIVIV